MSTPRVGEFERKTAETAVKVKLELDGSGRVNAHTGFGMLDHMLTLVFFWADMNCEIFCRGDLDVDAHHTTEDTGLALGNALRLALDDKGAIERSGYGRVPMDEALSEVSVDLSGRPWLEWRGDELLPPLIAGEEKDLWREFYKAFCSSGKFNLHVNFLYGKNGHHLLESAAKSLGVALRHAVSVREGQIRSTKGGLD